MQKYPIHILSISQYGSGLSQTGSQFSGALGRQRDYMDAIERYSVIVPSETGSETPIDHGGGLVIYPLVSRNGIHFFFKAYRSARVIHAASRVHAVMVDNPHVIGILGAFLKWRLHVPLVVHSMSDMIGNEWYVRERSSNRIKVFFIRFSISVADIIRVSTMHEVARLKTRGISDTKVVRIPFYIDQKSFTLKLAAVGESRDPNMVLYVGRLGPQKDIGTLVRAMALVRESHPDATLTIVGDGPDRRMLTSFAHSLNMEEAITFAGKIPYDQVVRYFKRAQLFAISSLHEGTCMVLHEAAVAGLPLVATEVAGARDFIREGVEGHLVPIGDHVALANKIGAVLDDTQGADRMGEAAKARMDAFTREAALEAWRGFAKRIYDMTTHHG